MMDQHLFIPRMLYFGFAFILPEVLAAQRASGKVVDEAAVARGLLTVLAAIGFAIQGCDLKLLLVGHSSSTQQRSALRNCNMEEQLISDDWW